MKYGDLPIEGSDSREERRSGSSRQDTSPCLVDTNFVQMETTAMMLMMLKTYLIRLREVKGGCCTMYSVHSGGDSAQLGY